MKLDTFDHIVGVPVHYARFTEKTYGTRGKGPRKVRLNPSFHLELESCFRALFKMCPLGTPEVFVSGGFYVPKAGPHGRGTAVDIDSFHWKDRDFVTLNYPQDERFYLAVEAVLRMHFGTVLDYNYNRAHRDHFHVDNGSPVAFYPSSYARTLFLQAALTHVWGIPVGIDGRYGPKTRNGVLQTRFNENVPDGHVFEEMTPANVTQVLTLFWETFLTETATRGFGG